MSSLNYFIFKQLTFQITNYNYKYNRDDIDDEVAKIDLVSLKLYTNFITNGIFLHNEIINIYNWGCCTYFYYYKNNTKYQICICITSNDITIFDTMLKKSILYYDLNIIDKEQYFDVELLPDNIINKIREI